MSNESPDREAQAIQTIISTLEPLGGEARQRVLAFSLNRLGISKIAVPEIRVAAAKKATKTPNRGSAQTIRALKRNKSPRFATQMAAVVAYYLSAVAPTEEQKNAIGHEDVRAYFKKAGFTMPKSPTDVLIHAAQTGYFDYLGDGQYRLTSTGRNLVLNDLPAKKK
jgi:hypothetical protein